MALKTPFCRVGTKKDLIPLIKREAPKSYNKYVEGFVGGGSVYFGLEIDVPAIINDLDKDLINGYRALKANPDVSDVSKYADLGIPAIEKLIKQPNKTTLETLAGEIYRTCATFGSKGGDAKIYKNPNITSKLKRVPQYAEYMKQTKILNQDYKSVLLKNDGENVFFYLDPPYEASKGLYKDDAIDLEEMAILLSKLKGKFVLSLNDSSNVRNIFKRFKIKGFTVKREKHMEIGSKDRKEVIIKNF